VVAEVPFPDPPLASGPLALRAWTVEDLPAAVVACQDPGIARFAASVPAPFGDGEAVAWLASHEAGRLAGRRLELAIVSTDSRWLMGSIALSKIDRVHERAMVGFWVVPQARGRGVASVALRLLADWAVGPLGLKRVELFIEPANAASHLTATRSGFVREGLLRSHWVSKGRRRDSVVYAFLADGLS
jgi:RimJ/RimL family protein N-acetyltransferase